ncbi:MAG: HEPN domain-containing protein [Eubacterium sp.]|nr:HEPN domain-containing protein [Eubacterium sp.]
MDLYERGSVSDLVRYRIETAKSDLQSANILMKEGEFRGANNRAYYAIYHAISAVHALNGNSYKRHKDTLANFNKDYIKTEIFPKAFGRKIARAEEIRHASDYDDFYIATKEKAEEQIMTAKELIELIEAYCLKKCSIQSI